MWNRVLILLLSSALMIVSGAEAMSGHCAKSTPAAPVTMSAHCAEMMASAEQTDPAQDSESESSVCCCVILTAPIMHSAPGIQPAVMEPLAWRLALNSSGPSILDKVAIPPPRV